MAPGVGGSAQAEDATQMADRFPNRPSFADNFDRGTQHEGGDAPFDSDPLAELARLIGQTDPQSNFARGRQSAATQPPASRSLATDFSAGPPSWLQTAQAQQGRAQPAYDEPDSGEAEHHPAAPELTPMPAFLQAQHPPQTQYPHAQQQAADRYDPVLYGHDDQEQQYGDHDQQQAYADDEYAEEPMDGRPAFLDSESRRRRTGGLLTVAVVLGLAVVGTAGAYAYRSYSGSPRSGTPPVIKADNAPSKVVPPTQAGDGSGKQIYDRIGGGGPERVVSREEQPVDVNAAAARPAFPSVGQTAAPSQQAASASDDGSGDAQPRKIRTVPIRGDQSNGASGAARQVASAPAPTAVRTVPVQTAAPVANGPMNLSPTAAPNNIRSASAAVPPAAAPTNVARTSGAYSVQIASQKTEAEAQASSRSAQVQYANVLGGMSPVVRRFDAGAKGVVYRVMVGPYRTSDDASKFCRNLKLAGGDCVVQRN
jgi:hypothetical protein